jgi:peptidoglycan/xylan/chitin deacetylase (PgdA/CDA1 family)
MPMNLDRWGNDLYDRKLRNGTNNNWDKIEGSYSNIEKTSNKATLDATAAITKASSANELSKNIQEQLNKAVIQGDSSVEAAQARVALNGTTFNVLNDRLNYMEASNPETGIIAFTHDDGFFEDRLTYSVFKEYGLPCTFALIKDKVFSYNYIDNYRQYQQDGFTIMSHSCTHQDMSTEAMSLQEAGYEIANSANCFGKFGLSVNGWVTPNSTLNDKYLDLIKSNYDYAVTRFNGTLDSDAIGHIKKSHDPYKMYRYSLTYNSLDRIKKAIDNCIKERGLLLFYDHRTGAGSGHVEEAKLREILAYAKSKVESKQCRVLNMNDAISSFFGKQLIDKTKGSATINVSPSLFDNTVSGLTEKKWFFSKHGNDLGEAYKTVSLNSENIGMVEYYGMIPKGKGNSLQTKLPLNNLNMNNIESQNVYFAQDVWVDGDISKAKFTFEVRFYAKDGSYDGTHVHKINVGNKRMRFEAVSTPYKLMDFSYAMVYLRFEALENIESTFKFYLGKPVISFGIPKEDLTPVRETPSLDNKEIRLSLDASTSLGVPWSPRTWIRYSLPTYENSYLKSSSTSTFEVKVSGFYNMNFNVHFNVDASGSPNASSRMVFDIGKSGFDPNVAERSICYFRPPDDRFSVQANHLLYLEKGENVYIRGFYDDTIGTCTEYKEKATISVMYMGFKS